MEIIYVSREPQPVQCTLSERELLEAQGPAGRWKREDLALYIWDRLGADNRLINGWSPLDHYVVLDDKMIRVRIIAQSDANKGILFQTRWELMSSKEVTALFIEEVSRHEEPEKPARAPSAAYTELHRFVEEKAGAS